MVSICSLFIDVRRHLVSLVLFCVALEKNCLISFLGISCPKEMENEKISHKRNYDDSFHNDGYLYSLLVGELAVKILITPIPKT